MCFFMFVGTVWSHLCYVVIPDSFAMFVAYAICQCRYRFYDYQFGVLSVFRVGVLLLRLLFFFL